LVWEIDAQKLKYCFKLEHLAVDITLMARDTVELLKSELALSPKLLPKKQKAQRVNAGQS